MRNMARVLSPRFLGGIAAVIVATSAVVAVVAVEAADDDAAAHCSYSSSYTEPVRGVLPVNEYSSDRHLAQFVMPYAMLSAHAGNRVDVNVEDLGFYVGPDSNQLFRDRGRGELLSTVVSGFKAATYIHCRDDAIVIVYGKTATKDPRDWVAAIVRYYSGGESELALSLLDAVRERYPGYSITLVGLSAGGSLASYVGSVSGLPSIVFNPVRTDAALYNTGENQLVVRVAGDVLSDPDAPPAPGIMSVSQRLTQNDGPMRGTLLLIDPMGDYRFLWELHWIETVIDEMRWMLQ